MADLYRKSALERISNPEQLDKVTKVTSPLSWLALMGLTAVMAVVIVWSIVGRIPVTVTTKGVISSPVGSNSVYIEEAGKVSSLRVNVGDEITYNTPILVYVDANGNKKMILSDQVGTVTEVAVENGQQLGTNTAVVRVTPNAYSKQIAVCYVPLAQAKKLKTGMRVNITLDSLDSQSYGNMWARVINVDVHPASAEGMANVLGSGNNMDATFTQSGPVVAVACEFYPESDNVSGYYWSNEKGGTVKVENGSLITAKIVTEETRPIEKLFGKLRDIWGD